MIPNLTCYVRKYQFMYLTLDKFSKKEYEQNPRSGSCTTADFPEISNCVWPALRTAEFSFTYSFYLGFFQCGSIWDMTQLIWATPLSASLRLKLIVSRDKIPTLTKILVRVIYLNVTLQVKQNRQKIFCLLWSICNFTFE